MGFEVKLCLRQQGLAGCLGMDNANDRAGRGWEGKESVREEFSSYLGLMAAPGEDPAKSSKAHNSAASKICRPAAHRLALSFTCS